MRWRWAGALLMALALVAVGCVGSTGKPTARSSPRFQPVAPSISTTVRSGDVSVDIPAGSVESAGRIGLSRSGIDLSGVPDGVTRVGEPVVVHLSGTELTGTATIRFTGVRKAHAPLVVVWQKASGGWEWLPTRVVGSTVTARTNHLSGGFLARIDVGVWARQRPKDLTTYVTGRADVAQPGCGDEQALRSARVTVTSDGGDSVKWCAGVDGGRNVMRVANNRLTYVMVAYPMGWEVLDGGTRGISVDALVRGGATWIGQRVTTPVGQTVRLLGGGDTLTLAMPSDPNGTVTVGVGTLAWAFSALAFGIEAYGGVLHLANAELGGAVAGSSGRLIADLNSGDPATAWTKAANACLSNNNDDVTDQPMKISGPDIARSVWRCVPSMMKADIESNGPEVFLAGAILSTVGPVVGAMFTALDPIISGASEIWDGMASVGGSNGPTYAIRVSTSAVAPPVDPGTSSSEDGGGSPGAIVSSFDPGALASFVASVPELVPSDSTQGCESIDLLSIDLGTQSARVFKTFSGNSPCPGDPMESYVQVDHGTVTRSVSCAENDQTGECAQFDQLRAMWKGRVVNTIDTWVCPGTSSGVCVGTMRRTTRS